MHDREFLKKVEHLGIGVFGVSDIARITGKDRGYACLFAKRLKNRGLIKSVEKGRYVFPDTDPLIVASNLVHPSYISFLSGLAYYHRTTQIPVETQVVYSKSKKSVKYDDSTISFVKLRKERVFGYRREKLGNGFTFVGEIEKVIVDALFLPRHCPVSETFNALKEGVDVEKIINYALRMNSIVTLKRLGYLLDLTDIDVYDKLKKHINVRYDTLSPNVLRKGEKNRKWCLLINEVV